MKIEEAIKRINEIKTEIDNWRDNLGEKLSERDVIDIQAYDIALQALEKQIPKEPNGQCEYLKFKSGYCPNCSTSVCGIDAYCPACGQRLKWE